MKQQDLAARVGVTPGAVSRWLAGTRLPTLDLMDKIATALDWPVCDQVADRCAYAEALRDRMDDNDE